MLHFLACNLKWLCIQIFQVKDYISINLPNNELFLNVGNILQTNAIFEETLVDCTFLLIFSETTFPSHSCVSLGREPDLGDGGEANLRWIVGQIKYYNITRRDSAVRFSYTSINERHYKAEPVGAHYKTNILNNGMCSIDPPGFRENHRQSRSMTPYNQARAQLQVSVSTFIS